MSVFLQAAALVSESPGSLVYHLVLLFALGIGAGLSASAWRTSRTAATTRLALAATALFLLRITSLALALLGALTLIDPLVIIPPVDRAAGALSLVLIVWVAAFPRPARWADAAAGLLSVLIVLALGISLALWSQEALARGFYNGQPQETAWEAAKVVLLLGGLALLAFRRQADWLLGAACLVVLLAGHALHLAQTIAGTNVPGAERLAEIVAMPLFVALVYRRGVPSAASAPGLAAVAPAASPGSVPAVLTNPAAADVTLVHAPGSANAAIPSRADVPALAALARLATVPGVAALGPAVTEAVARAARSPFAVLLVPDDSGEAYVAACAFPPENAVGPAAVRPQLQAEQEPDLMAALGQGQVARWPAERLPGDLQALAKAAGALPQPGAPAGPVWVMPLAAGDRLLGALALWPAPNNASPAAEARIGEVLAALTAPLGDAWSAALRQADDSQALAGARSELAEAREHAASQAEQVLALTNQLQLQRRAEAVRAEQIQELETLRNEVQALTAEAEDHAQHVQQLESQLAATGQPAAPKAARTESEPTLAFTPEHASMPSEVTVIGRPALELQLEAASAREQALAAELDQARGREQDLAEALAKAQASAAELAAAVEATRAQDQMQLAELERRGAERQRQSDEAAQAQVERDQRIVQLHDELEVVRAELDQVARQAAQAAAAAPAFEGYDLATMVESLAAAEARLAEQKKEITGLREALVASEERRQSAAPGHTGEAADMEVIASLSQELRQPMSSITGYTDLLLSESVGILGALQRKFLERIKASAERMGVLLDDLLRVMDIDSGQLTLASESVDVSRVIDDALHGCEALFQEKNIHLTYELPPQLPAIQADRDALLQIFTHLLNNSGAASAQGTAVRLAVQCESDQRPGGAPQEYLVISVSDTGGGIAPEDQPRVFSRLYRAEAPLIAGLGDNGMGLSIAKALVEAHGGRIWVISEPGVGSTFYVLLPREGKPARSNGTKR